MDALLYKRYGARHTSIRCAIANDMENANITFSPSLRFSVFVDFDTLTAFVFVGEGEQKRKGA